MADISAALKSAADRMNTAREAWREQSNTVRAMGDENGGWGTDSDYRRAARKRDDLWTAYAAEWRTFAAQLNADVGAAILDPESAS